MKRSWRNRSVLMLLSLFGAAAPLGQIVRIVEDRATQDAPAHYALIVGQIERSSTTRTEKSKQTDSTDSKKSQPRFIKLLTDHWDVSAGIEFSVADVPVSATAFVLDNPVEPRCSIAHLLPFSSGPPIVPTSRGPPALS